MRRDWLRALAIAALLTLPATHALAKPVPPGTTTTTTTTTTGTTSPSGATTTTDTTTTTTGPTGTTTTTATATVTNPAEGSKKAAYLAAKQTRSARPRKQARPIGKPPAPVINLRNTWTNEWLVVGADGRGDPDQALVDRFLRDHYTNGPTTMDPRLIKVLREAAHHFSAGRIDIVSGFRAPKYNLMLRKKGHEVARDSQHTHGNAVDFRIPGVAVDALHDWARSRKLGGVGLYRGSGFIHMDTGRIRYWDGS